MNLRRPALVLSWQLALPWLVLASALGTTWLAWQHERQNTQRALLAQLDFALRESVSRIEQRVGAYELALRGAQGFVTSNGLANRAAFHTYMDTLQLDANYSGVKVTGLIQWMPAGPETAPAAPGAGGQTGRASIVHRELHTSPGQEPPAFDPFSEPIRRKAMERARDSGAAAISGMVHLAIDRPQEAPAGFIMYLPVYAADKPHDSIASRRRALVGWVYAAFHMRDFMASLYGRAIPDVALRLYDDVGEADDTLMYQSTGAESTPADLPTATEYLVVGGHTWTLLLTAQEGFVLHYGRDASTAILVAGCGLGLALTVLVWLMVTGRARAVRMAERMTDRLRHMAQHDPLTDLPNRALFADRLHLELARAKRHQGRFALVFLDLDHFKPVNDRYGHAVGDQVLTQIARRLLTTIRASDTAGRIGGDEFVVLMPELNTPEAALVLAEKIREAVRHPVEVGGLALSVSCSVGVAVYPEDGLDEISLTKSADDAMYLAKAQGRNGVHMARSALQGRK
ncbi:MAG: diguanylate cyclase [Rhodoferax sp.]